MPPYNEVINYINNFDFIASNLNYIIQKQRTFENSIQFKWLIFS